MSSYLWKAYYENDVVGFRHCLQTATYNVRSHVPRGGGGPVIGSPSNVGTSPIVTSRARKTPGSSGQSLTLTKADLNARDATGQTILHHAASSIADTAIEFATVLIEHPLTDLYLQDYENGWTALHRAFYFGNISIARLILERDASDIRGKGLSQVHQTSALIKVKDREGFGPLDLYAATIKDRSLRPNDGNRPRSGSDGSDEDRMIGENGEEQGRPLIPSIDINGDQLFTFGSNRNLSLGFGDQDDRQFPERVSLRRPEQLLRQFYVDYMQQRDAKWMAHDTHHKASTVDASSMWIEDVPWMPKSVPLMVQDVQMSKLHSAVLTSDSESNLYICGHGQSGRLGTGDETTRFHFVCIETGALAGKKVATVALGLNHTLAVSDEGEIFSWGSNAFGQLGYSLPKTASADEEPISTIPRQIYGTLKRETVIGVAASRLHSVVHTGNSLFTFGKNEGQLGIMDSDARSLEVQTIPRRVAASLFASNIAAVAAMDKATVCLLENDDVWVFANYGYVKPVIQLEGFTNHFLQQSFLLTSYDHTPNSIVKITCGGDSVCALSTKGQIFTFAIDNSLDGSASASTTNPAKIRNAIAKDVPCIWSPKSSNMAARDVAVDVDGSIILSTEEGSVWKRTKRVNIKDATASGIGEYKPKAYKFSRIPGLTRILAVRASAHGAYAAVKRDCDVTKTQINVDALRLWNDLTGLLSLRQPHFKHVVDEEMDLETRHRFWQGRRTPDQISLLKRAVLESKDIESDLEFFEERCFSDSSANFDALIATTTSDIRIPIHRFILTARSRVMRRGFRDLCETSTFTVPETTVSEIDKDGRTVVRFVGLDIFTIINLVIYLYTDNLIDFWHLTRNAPQELAPRYRQVRIELMKIAPKLELSKLEQAARQMVQPRPCLNMDLDLAFHDAAFFYDGDVVIQLEDDEIRAHSALVCARCPFFEGLFMGRAGGRWLAGREEDDEINVDLQHINSKTFNLVLRHIYTDCGEEMFDEIVSIGLDGFLDNVMDVLSVANELMLDRLSQICQKVIGRYVNVRNVCGLLNAISPSSVHEFKDAALEYLCLSMEAMLQGHYLNELDEDLLYELDEIVRENQLECMRHARNGRAEQLLHERHPDLAASIARNRQARIDAASLRARHLGLDTFAPGSYGDELSSSPMAQKSRRKSSSMPQTKSPVLKGKSSARDMMFAMDDDGEDALRSPDQSPSIRAMSKGKSFEPSSSSLHEETWYDSRGKALPSPNLEAQHKTPRTSTTPKETASRTPPSAGQPWKMTPLASHRTDMKAIMAQTASSRTSILSESLATSQPMSDDIPTPLALPGPKMSQKERKRHQQAQQTPTPSPDIEKRTESSPLPKAPAWQTQSAPKVPTIKEVLASESPSDTAKPASNRTTSTPHLTMRQTVANTKPGTDARRPTTGSSKQGTPQQCSVSNPDSIAPGSPDQSKLWQPSPSSNSKPIPQSIRHQPPSEPILGLSMSEIVAQQQLEKDVVKEAVAPRDLQDIQAEQEFEEWWSRESARVQEAERKDAAAATTKHSKKQRGRGGRGGRRSKEKADQSSTS